MARRSISSVRTPIRIREIIMRAIYRAALAATALTCALPAQAAVAIYFETEPNNTRAGAEALNPRYSPTDPSVVIGYFGSVAGEGTGLVDWFSFNVPAIVEGIVFRDIKLEAFGQSAAGAPAFVLTDAAGTVLDPAGALTQAGGTFYVGLGNNASLTAAGYFAQITITAIPEPGTWALMLAGFAMTGYALRRRRAKVAFA
jgi:hypothetical protein